MSTNPQLGEGIYIASDIAQILRLPANTVRRWLKDFWGNESWSVQNSRAVNFHSLIEFYVFYQLKKLGMSTQQIRKTHKEMSKRLQCPYPFATYKLLALGSEKLFFSQSDGKELLTADSLHYTIKEFTEPFCKKIEFADSEAKSTAVRFFPDGRESSIVVDPHHQFGQPVIKGTNLLAETIYLYHKGGETHKSIAEMFSINEKNVNDAIDYFKNAA